MSIYIYYIIGIVFNVMFKLLRLIFVRDIHAKVFRCNSNIKYNDLYIIRVHQNYTIYE